MTLRRFVRIIAIALLSLIPLALGAVDLKEPPKFTPPNILYASDIPYLSANGAAGLVGLLVTLDSSAKVDDVQVLRDIPSLSGPALLKVNSWTFAPAKLNGKPSPATLPVNIVFCPWDTQSATIPLPPVEAVTQSRDPVQFAPAEIAAASYPAYPAHSNPVGTIVLDVTIDRAGRAVRISVTHALAISTKPAVAAAKAWKFKPGTLDGVPVRSRMIVVFVFRSPSIPNS